jgi:hypothetical protein
VTHIPTTCGIDVHDAECLCDVNLDNRSPINWALNEVWHAPLIMRTLEMSAPWTRSKLADLLEAIGYAYDITRNITTHADDRDALRNQIVLRAHNGESILEIADDLGHDVAVVASAITRNAPSTMWTWDRERWATVESWMRSNSPVSIRGASRHLDVSRNVITTLADVFGLPMTVGRKRTTVDTDALTALDEGHLKDCVG